MTRPQIMVGHLRFEAARAALGLARYQMRYLVASGQLETDAQNSFSAAQIRQLAAQPEVLAQMLVAETRLVSTQACKLLGISLFRFRAAAKEGLFRPVGFKPFRPGRKTPLYRRGDLLSARGPYLVWLKQRLAAPRVHDPAVASRRRQRRSEARLARDQISGLLRHEQSKIAHLPTAEQALARVALWLTYLQAYKWELGNYVPRSKGHAKALLERGREITVPYEDALGILTTLDTRDHPALNVTLCGDGQISFCEACLKPRPNWYGEFTGNGHSAPGCRYCQTRTSELFLAIEIKLSGDLSFCSKEIDFAKATADWFTFPDQDLITQPSVFFLGEALRGAPGALGRDPHYPLAVWNALSLDERQTRWQAWRQQVFAARLDGESPQETLPAYLASLARRNKFTFQTAQNRLSNRLVGPLPPTQTQATARAAAIRRVRQVFPVELVVKELKEGIDELNDYYYVLKTYQPAAEPLVF